MIANKDDTLVTDSPNLDTNALSPSPVKVLLSIIDLICKEFDEKTLSIIDQDVDRLKKSIAKIDNRLIANAKIETGSHNAKRHNESKVGTDVSNIVDKPISNASSQRPFKPNQNQCIVPAEKIERQQGREGQVEMGNNKNEAHGSPTRRRSRRLSQPYLSPIGDTAHETNQVSY